MPFKNLPYFEKLILPNEQAVKDFNRGAWRCH